MFNLPRLHHVAASRVATRFSRPEAWRGCTIATQNLSPARQHSVLTGTSPSRWSARKTTRDVSHKLSKNNTRRISVAAPREPIAGSEPGIDITDEDAWPQWRQKVRSQITAVDFSIDRIEKYELNNETLRDFLQKPREDWVTCRWINGKTQLTTM